MKPINLAAATVSSAATFTALATGANGLIVTLTGLATALILYSEIKAAREKKTSGND